MMNPSIQRYGATCLVLLGYLGALGNLASCRYPERPAPASGSAAVPAAPGPGEPLAEGSLEASDVQVQIHDFKFVPEHLTVRPGTKVTWVNKDDEPHSATSSEKPKRFDSGVLDSDQSFSFTFTEQGSFSYFCKLHPHMTGIVEIR